MIFFTADTHFGHNNVIRFCDRPFSSAAEMDEVMIRNWNARVTGGDTVYMMQRWKETGLLPLIADAYERGVILCGLSAGAICWFSDIYTDSAARGNEDKYSMYSGLGWIKGKISPHYGARMVDFDKILCYNNYCAYGLEDDSAIVIRNGSVAGALTSGGTAWKIVSENGALKKTAVTLLK